MRRRLAAGALTACCVGVLLVAGSLTPETDGLGTHQQLGLAACAFHAERNLPCPTCGMTTAFAHAAQGRLLTAFIIQPAGAALALATAMAALAGGYVMWTGSLAGRYLMRVLWRGRTAWALAALIAGGWAYALAVHGLWR